MGSTCLCMVTVTVGMAATAVMAVMVVVMAATTVATMTTMVCLTILSKIQKEKKKRKRTSKSLYPRHKIKIGKNSSKSMLAVCICSRIGNFLYVLDFCNKEKD